MAKVPVLNWYARPKRLTRGLRKLFRGKIKTIVEGREKFPSFITIRLGPKWASKLNPGDRVAISISDDPNKPNIIGYAEVGDVSKKTLFFMESKDLEKNIGAKAFRELFMDLQSVYGSGVSVFSTISIIDLSPAE